MRSFFLGPHASLITVVFVLPMTGVVCEPTDASERQKQATQRADSVFCRFSSKPLRKAAHLGNLGEEPAMSGTGNGSLLSTAMSDQLEIRLSGSRENLDHDLESCRIGQLRFAGMTLPSAADKSTFKTPRRLSLHRSGSLNQHTSSS